MRPSGWDVRDALTRILTLVQVRSVVAERIQRRLLPFALGAFIVAAALAARAYELPPDGIAWGYVAIALVAGVPATVALNAIEVSLAGQLVGRTIPLMSAVRIAVLGSAANVLPIPGALLVRMGDLLSRGTRPQLAFRAQVAIGFMWAGISCLGVAIATAQESSSQSSWFWYLLAALGVVLGTIVLPQRSLRYVVAILGVEAMAVVLIALRLTLAWSALGLGVDASASIAIAGANALAALVWVIPSGLALREGISAALASVVGLPPAVGVSGQVVDRLVGFVGHAVLIPLLSRSSRSR